MKKRKITGLITILAAIPRIGYILFFVTHNPAFLIHWVVIEKLLIATACILGGIFLWRGSIWGYRFSVLGWVMILWASASNIYVALAPSTNDNLSTIMLSNDMISSILCLTILSMLLGDILRIRKI